jgi:hypothetical protein
MHLRNFASNALFVIGFVVLATSPIWGCANCAYITTAAARAG